MNPFLYLFTICIITSSPLTKENTIWTDEFEIKHSRWKWDYNSGTGYKFLNPDFEGLSVVECGIRESASDSSYSDCSLLTFLPPQKVFTFKTRLKFSNNNGPDDSGRGTKGFGFWDGVGENFAWFISFSPESAINLVGFQVQVRSDGGAIQSTKIKIDLTKWHEYQIEVKENLINFYIDGVEQAYFSTSLNNLKKCSIWLDNYKINANLSREYLDSKLDEKLWIDWVKRIK
jgi:hypothetical protein